MQESNAAEIIKTFITMIGLFFIFGMVYVFYKVNQVSDFEQDVNNSIERQGGLTASSIANLKKLSEDQYGGIFYITEAQYDSNKNGKLDSSDTTVKASNDKSFISGTPENLQYGTAFQYKINISVPIPFMSGLSESQYKRTALPTSFNTQAYGRATTKVRTINDR